MGTWLCWGSYDSDLLPAHALTSEGLHINMIPEKRLVTVNHTG